VLFSQTKKRIVAVPYLFSDSAIYQGFLVCSSTQTCSSKEICAVLLSKMCSWQMDNSLYL